MKVAVVEEMLFRIADVGAIGARAVDNQAVLIDNENINQFGTSAPGGAE